MGKFMIFYETVINFFEMILYMGLANIQILPIFITNKITKNIIKVMQDVIIYISVVSDKLCCIGPCLSQILDGAPLFS